MTAAPRTRTRGTSATMRIVRALSEVYAAQDGATPAQLAVLVQLAETLRVAGTQLAALEANQS